MRYEKGAEQEEKITHGLLLPTIYLFEVDVDEGETPAEELNGQRR